MKQVVQNYKSGELALLDVPTPACKSGGVLVRTLYSLISTGTEMMKVSEASLSLVGKARARPDQVAKVVQSVATNGLAATYRKVTNKLDSYTPLGYSLCGVVEQVGDGIEDVSVGDLVACAGNEHALHSELNWVPKNLYSRVPDGVDPRHAAFGTVGSIAMQGVRRGEPQLGELALVIGLGLIGQLVVQLLVASGVRVVGVDLDPARCELAERLGALVCSHPGSGVVDTAVGELSSGHGVDQVYLASGGSSNEPVELAAKLARDRGRVVDIGKCSLNLPWNAYYEKELDVRFSRSYGPGRYDPSYELEGKDYPIGQVRWTERRNLECVLDLVARGRVDFEPLISHVAEFSTAVDTYQRLNAGELKAVAVLFSYPGSEAPTLEPVVTSAPVVLSQQAKVSPRLATVRAAFVGAGNYASSMLLPHLAERSDVELRRVVTTSALSGANAKRKFGFAEASTDLDATLADPSIDAIFVVTRHSSHAALTRRALLAGKAVFVEKPLALSEEELSSVLSAIEESGNDRLQVGFNRRFAPLLLEAKEQFGQRVAPASVRYLVNAGKLDGGSWYNQQDTEGSRFAGEGGHFIDTVSWLLDGDPTSVYACSTPGQDDLQIVLRYPDGSTATVTYATSGASGFPKETLDVVADGKVLKFDDFVRATVYGRKKWASSRIPRGRDKGQCAELGAFVDAVKSGGPMPVPLDSLVATTLATLAVSRSLASGVPVRLAPGEVRA
ncbi:bi-domain-containing oxidoreductase [Amycolatopsis sp. H20-H5]|uniref:bi-domain-containing oxidoreductase n=1 Tax=Amycolatopsis sp. H20-H5 TaxID=3046309 RepID=UPI002DB6C5CD|nr:bi-domain-containing oxidoreductase [Amycolatopsis sp. H20-H5]MEC3976541.1 bi-domain-containing oxidoreductase [Amycolatopsis sp. H20-H5]